MIRSLALRLVAAGLLIVSARLSAQSAIFLDRSYAVRMSPDRGLLYEAVPAFPLFLNNRTAGLYSSLLEPAPRWSTGSMLVFTPMFRIRQVEEKESASQPVRMPSFMPKLTAQFLAARRIGGTVRRAAAETPLSAMIVGLDLSFGHYSNGQAGCFRANERPKPDGSGGCEVDATAGPGADTLNTVDGSFSTWYLRGQTHLRFAHYRDSLPLVAFTLSGGADWHPAFLEPIGGMDTALAAVYGRLRPFAGAELMRQSEWPCAPTALLSWLPCGLGRVRASVNVEYIGTHPPRVSNVATTSELAWTFRRYAGLGALVRLHTGQDYYNMALGHELNVLQYGVTFDLERFDPLRSR
jgi:hypothetical protein